MKGVKGVRRIYNVFMRAVKEGSIPFGYYGPETCRWATPAEMRALWCIWTRLGKLTAKLRGKGRISQDRHSGSYGGSNEKGRFASAPAVAAASGNGYDEGAGGLKQHLQFLADFHKSQTCRQPGGAVAIPSY